VSGRQELEVVGVVHSADEVEVGGGRRLERVAVASQRIAHEVSPFRALPRRDQLPAVDLETVVATVYLGGEDSHA
jgi:hypothetical protein